MLGPGINDDHGLLMLFLGYYCLDFLLEMTFKLVQKFNINDNLKARLVDAVSAGKAEEKARKLKLEKAGAELKPEERPWKSSSIKAFARLDLTIGEFPNLESLLIRTVALVYMFNPLFYGSI